MYTYKIYLASNHDELNCSNEENGFPPTIDKSTIECPQIEVLYL